MKQVVELVRTILSALFDPIVEYVTCEISRAYLSGFERLRRVFLSLLFHIFAVVLALAGFLLVHLAIFFLLPCSQQVSSLIMLVIGIFYIAIAGIYIVRKSSAKNWKKMAGGDL
jgi:hypothetical protein